MSNRPRRRDGLATGGVEAQRASAPPTSLRHPYGLDIGSLRRARDEPAFQRDLGRRGSRPSSAG